MHDLHEVFGEDGLLAASLQGFAPRTEQLEMAAAAARAIQSRGRLIVEAGTGTGKTFAYLVPALLSGRRVIVSTGTRTLQDQLFHRDLPALAQALGRPARAALLKGRANYLCLHRLELAEQQAYARGMRRDLATALAAVRAWSRFTRRGDVAELAQLSETDPVWSFVTSTRDNCLGAECAFFERCHVVQARREAQAADVVIVNHHLLMADLMLKEEGFGDLLPGADAIIIDEAHQLPEVAAAFLGFNISTRQLQSLAADLNAELATSAASLEGGCAAFSRVIDRCCLDLHDALRVAGERCEFERWSSSVVESLERLVAELNGLIQTLGRAPEHVGLTTVRRRAVDIAARLQRLLSETQDEPNVRWAQANKHSVSFHYAPIDTAEQLAALVDAHASAWVWTSATLAVGDSFEHFTRRLGVDDATTLRLGSPFDYARQTLLYLPRGLDSPSSARHPSQVVEIALPILAASQGRAFLLFTSHRALREAAAVLAHRLGPSPPFPILVQGDAPRDRLLSRFREHGAAVLLGTSSFWEGVDVKGAPLCVVVIDKLPFAAPDDPLLKARLEAIERRGGNPFLEEQVPQAVLALKQGVGRLMRDAGDFGVIVLCDERVRTRSYGRLFLESLPPMPGTDDPTRVVAFLTTRLGALGLAPPTAGVIA